MRLPCRFRGSIPPAGCRDALSEGHFAAAWAWLTARRVRYRSGPGAEGVLPAWHRPLGASVVKALRPCGWPAASLDDGRSQLGSGGYRKQAGM